MNDAKDARRWRALLRLGRCNSKHSGLSIGDSLKAKLAFRFWCSPVEVEALIDQRVTEPEPTTYQVGPGKTYTDMSTVPWQELQPGDVVELHYPYNVVSDSCTWTNDGDGLWIPACDPKSPWMFEDGSPSENKARFCMKCGKPLKEVHTPEEDDDA